MVCNGQRMPQEQETTMKKIVITAVIAIAALVGAALVLRSRDA